MTTIRHAIDCEQALSRLFDFLDHELENGEERSAIQRHLDTCRSCFSRASFERRLRSKVRELRGGDAVKVQAAERIGRLLRGL